MRPPKPWEAVYAADRRKHRHRCRCCRRIIEPGDNVLMWRETARVSRAVHLDCADKIACCSSQFFEDMTWRQYATERCAEYARKLGHDIPFSEYWTGTRPGVGH